MLALLFFVASLVAAPAAMAAPATVTFSNQTFDKTATTSGESTRFSFNWAIADGSKSGDTFSIVLPNELRPSSTAGFALRNSANDVVANAVWSGNTATFTLTGFVNDKTSVNGSAYFSVSWNRNEVDTINGGEYSLRFTGSGSWTLPLTLLPDGPSGDAQSTSKVGWWLSDDQGASSPARQLGWAVYLDTGTGAHVNAPVVIVDTPGPSSSINIESVKGYVNNVEMNPERYTVAREGARGVRIELFGNHPGESAVYAGENIYFRYDSNLLPGENGVFRNSAVVSGLADDPQRVSAEVLRDGAGGDGDGEVRSVAPVMPQIVQAQCTAEGTTTPALTFPNTDGVTYTRNADPAPGATITVTATAADGYVLTTANGWTLADDNRTA
ncbi:Ig-like domain-containing protein, partial [Microbacterium sp. NPDC055312]